MKKKIIVCAFSILIFVTAIAFLIGAIDSYKYDMDPNNGVDIFEGFGAVLIAGVGGFVVFYELDLFYTVYYFLIKPKTITKSILNIFSNFTLLLIFFSNYIGNIGIMGKEVMVPIFLFFVYLILRIVCAAISVRQSAK